MTAKNTKSIIRSLENDNIKALQAIGKRNELIAQLKSKCRHHWKWLNDPYEIYHHECTICGHTAILDSIKSKAR